MCEEQIKDIIKQAICEYEKKKKEEKKEEAYHNTHLLMKNYNIIKAHVYDLDGEITDISDQLRIEKSDTWLYTISRSKAQSLKMLGYVKDALRIVERRYKKKDEWYKYLAFKLTFIKEMGNEDIMKELKCSKNRPRIWTIEVLSELSKVLWGMEAI